MIPAAIPTRYKGYHFRSRMEARWAVYLDALGVAWQYEPEGYLLPSGKGYLPDFYLPEIGTYLEIKGEPTRESHSTCEEFAIFIGKRVLLCAAEPMLMTSGFDYKTYHMLERAFVLFFPSSGADQPYLFCSCPVCKKVGIEFDGRGGRVCGKCTTDDKAYSADSDRFILASHAARSARFEHGHSGAS